MTVLSFADTRFPIERANGAQTFATCHALAARGHGVTLVVRPDSADPPRDPFEFYGLARSERLHVETVPTVSAPGVNRARFLLAALRRARRSPDVIYTRDLGVASLLLTCRPAISTPLIYESHGITPVVSEEMPKLLGQSAAPSAQKIKRLDRRERHVWARASAYVTITQALADDLATRYGPRDRVFVVPDGAAVPVPNPAGDRATRPGQRPVAAYAGHLYPWKGVDVFVQALALTPGVDGLIVGGHPAEPDVRRVAALAQTLGVNGRLTITGLVRPAEVMSRLADASILVLPNTASTTSERYTSPLKLFEYLHLGHPIVASDLTAIREVLTDGETALLVPPGDAGALARALERLAGNPTLAGALGAAARALAERYTWTARAARLEAAFAAARS